MRILLDLCMSPAVLEAVRAAGHDAVRVSVAPDERPDTAVIGRAIAEHRLIVTMDKDFGEILSTVPGPRVGVLRIRDMPPSRQIEFVLAALERHGSALEQGALVVAAPGHTRVRMPHDG